VISLSIVFLSQKTYKFSFKFLVYYSMGTEGCCGSDCLL